MPSGSSSASAPIARRFATTAAMRSLSFTRSSLGAGDHASRPRRASRGTRAAAARRSSPAPRAASDRTPRSSPRRDDDVGDRFAALDARDPPRRRSRPSRASCVEEPDARLVDADALEHGARPRRRAPRAPAKNAADEDRPAPTMSSGVELDVAVERDTRCSSTDDRARRAPTSIRSVWSRERAARSPRARTPATSAASRIALLTCALADFAVPLDRRAASPPRIVIGRPPCAGSSTRAPIASSGRATRRIGRRLRLASPMNVAAIGRRGDDAGHQARRRAAVAAVEVGASACAARARPTPAIDEVRRRASGIVDAERAQHAGRRVHVGRLEDARHARLALRPARRRSARGARSTCRPARAACRTTFIGARPRAPSRGRSSRRGTSR